LVALLFFLLLVITTSMAYNLAMANVDLRSPNNTNRSRALRIDWQHRSAAPLTGSAQNRLSAAGTLRSATRLLPAFRSCFFVTLLIIMSNILLRSFLLDAQCDKLAEVAVCRLLRQSMDTTVEERGPRPTGTCGRSV